jgi:hypothetical protein
MVETYDRMAVGLETHDYGAVGLKEREREREAERETYRCRRGLPVVRWSE